MRRPTTRILLGSIVPVLVASVASAQIPVTEADRPGEATPVTIVPAGALQFESGLRLTRSPDAARPRTDALSWPNLLVRFGVADWIELRAEAEGLVQQFRRGAPDRTLGSDLELGAKIRLLRGGGRVPAVGALLGLSLPTGSAPVSSDAVDPRLDALVQWPLGPGAALLLNAGFSAPTLGASDPRRIFRFDPRAALSGPLTSSLSIFGEYYGAIRTGGVADQHSLDGGLAWMIPSRRLQLDVSAGVGLNDAAPAWFVAAGASIRFGVTRGAAGASPRRGRASLSAPFP